MKIRHGNGFNGTATFEMPTRCNNRTMMIKTYLRFTAAIGDNISVNSLRDITPNSAKKLKRWIKYIAKGYGTKDLYLHEVKFGRSNDVNFYFKDK